MTRRFSPMRALRSLLQIELFQRVTPMPRVKTPSKSRKDRSADQLVEIWRTLRLKYFPERVDLDAYTIRWSTRRQRRVLASCNISKNVVSVARELDHPSMTGWLEPLLYHELCHAVIGKGVNRESGRRAWHGREFRALEARHPRIRDLDRWIRAGGFRVAVRRARAREVWEHRRR